MNLKKNDILTLSITGMTTEGSGIGRADGIAVFVPLTTPGDKAQVRIVKVAKSFAYGKLEELIVPAPTRIQPDCPVFSQCGGCCYRHITYAEELRIKAQRVQDALERIGGFSQPPLSPILGAESRDGYRNKALLPLELGKDGTLKMGFYAVNSHRVVDCPHCALQPGVFRIAMDAFRRWFEQYGDTVYEESAHKGVLRRLYLRWGEKSGEISVCVVINGTKLRHEQELVEILKESLPGLTSVIINQNTERTNVALGKICRTIYGADCIQDELCGLRFQISPLSFYQVNRTQAQRLYEKAREYAGLTGEETLLDLYCGTGTIGLSMAKKAKKLIGVEIVPQAIENAKKNGTENHIDNAEFLCGDAAQAAQVLAQRREKPDVIILDPPRKGCSETLIQTVAALLPSRIIYISCDPATLARDLKLFATLNYPPQEITPLDMFPGTAHVECVVLMSRADK